MIPQKLVGRVRNPTMSCQLPFNPCDMPSDYHHHDCHHHDCHPCPPMPPMGMPSDCDGDYAGLSNKPSINGVILEGDKSFEQLGLVDIESETIVEMYNEIVDADFITKGEEING